MKINCRMVLEATCQALGVSESDLIGKGRDKYLTLARVVYAVLCRELEAGSYIEIAKAMGAVNHSSVAGRVKAGVRLILNPAYPLSEARAMVLAQLGAALLHRESHKVGRIAGVVSDRDQYELVRRVTREHNEAWRRLPVAGSRRTSTPNKEAA